MFGGLVSLVQVEFESSEVAPLPPLEIKSQV